MKVLIYDKEKAKLITEFVGRCGTEVNTLYTFPKLFDLIHDTWVPLEDTQFHFSWSWLMCVVEKINLMDDYKYTVTIKSMDCIIMDNTANEVIIVVENKYAVDDLFNAVYDAVVRFIEMYNRRNK